MQDQPVVKQTRRSKFDVAIDALKKLTRVEKEDAANALAVLIDKDKDNERRDLQARLDALK